MLLTILAKVAQYTCAPIRFGLKKATLIDNLTSQSGRRVQSPNQLASVDDANDDHDKHICLQKVCSTNPASHYIPIEKEKKLIKELCNPLPMLKQLNYAHKISFGDVT